MDKNRRKFLKILFIGSGAFLIERVLDPIFSKLLGESVIEADSLPDLSPSIQANFKGFRVVENKKSLSFYDSSGEEILQIDKKV